MRGLFVDTSAWIATLERASRAHRPVLDLLTGFPGRLYTSNWVVDEAITLSRVRHGHGTAVALGRSILTESDVHVLRVSADHEGAAWQIFVDRPDHSFSFTDCTSFVLMRGLGIDEVATLDRDFAHEGFLVLPAE